jgi:hypothetical protein
MKNKRKVKYESFEPETQNKDGSLNCLGRAIYIIGFIVIVMSCLCLSQMFLVSLGG